MIRTHISFMGLFCLISSSQTAFADDLTLAAILQQDGPYIEIPAGYEVPSTAPNADDILQMADLDGDPTVTTLEETAMIAVLMQVLIGVPVAR